MSGLITKTPFRIELSRQKNGKLCMKKETTRQDDLPETRVSNKNKSQPNESLDLLFENEENLELAIEKWANYYNIKTCAVLSLKRILANNEDVYNNLQIFSDGEGGLSINIKNKLVKTITSKTDKNKMSLKKLESPKYATDIDRTEQNQTINYTDTDNDNPAKKRRLSTEVNDNCSSGNFVITLPCETSEKFFKFVMNCKNDRTVLDKFKILLLDEKKMANDVANYVAMCLGLVFGESIISNFNWFGSDNKCGLSGNFIITQIQNYALKLFLDSTEKDIKTIIAKWFESSDIELMDQNMLKQLLDVKLMPLLKRNEHKIYENTLIKLLKLPCNTIADFVQLDQNCQDKQNCQRLCMILLKQNTADSTSKFVQACLDKIFTNDIILTAEALQSINNSFIFQIIKQCSEQYFEDITDSFVQNEITEYFKENLIDDYEEISFTSKQGVECTEESFSPSDNGQLEKYKNPKTDVKKTKRKLQPENVFRVPCESLHEIKTFSSLCSTNKIFSKNVQNFLLKKKDQQLVKYIPNCLKAIFSKELATIFSWTGLGSNKNSVQTLFFLSILLECVHKLFPESTNKEREKIIMDWFRYAPKRFLYTKKENKSSNLTALIRLDVIDHEIINNFKDKPDNVIRNFESEFHLPCKLHEELDILNRDCETPDQPKFKALVAIFLNIKHKNPRRYAKLCMEKIFSPVLGTQYNWTGRGSRQKHGFAKFPIYRVLKSCFRQLYQEEDLNLFEKDCIKFFKYTSQRLISSLENEEDTLQVTDLCEDV